MVQDWWVRLPIQRPRRPCGRTHLYENKELALGAIFSIDHAPDNDIIESIFGDPNDCLEGC
jgi:hypothetical protein